MSRLVAPIGAGEGNARYYADLLQIHLGTVAAGLQAAGLWPANLPLLLDAAQLTNYDQLLQLVRERHEDQSEIVARLREHRAIISAPEGRRDLTGGILRLRVVAGESWRRTLTPDPARGAVTLPAALRAGAVVLVRTWVDDLPDEARAITTLFLADAAAAALTLPEGTQWAALIDEFGGVLSSGAGERALALLQRARSAGGQVAVTTQSVVDFAAATGNPALDRRARRQLRRRHLPPSELARVTRLALAAHRNAGGMAVDGSDRGRGLVRAGHRLAPTRARVPRAPRRVPQPWASARRSSGARSARRWNRSGSPRRSCQSITPRRPRRIPCTRRPGRRSSPRPRAGANLARRRRSPLRSRWMTRCRRLRERANPFARARPSAA